MEETHNGVNGYEEFEEEIEEEIEEEVEEEEEEEEQPSRGGGSGGKVGGQGTTMAADKVDSSNAENKEASSDFGSIGKIFVGGIAWETTEESFRMYFEKYGEITDSVIMVDKVTRKPRGFGFVTFADPSVIDRVFEEEHVIDGRSVDVKRTVPKKGAGSAQKWGPKTKKIFLGGLPTTVTEDDLRDHFSKYGAIVEQMIMVDHSTGRSRGFGFVTFDSEEAVDNVMSDGNMHEIGGKQVEIKKAEPKRSDPQYSSRNSGRSYRGGSGYSGGGSNSGANSFGYGGGSYQSGGYGYGSAAGYGYGPSAGRGGYGYGTGAAGYGAAGYGAGYGSSMYGYGAGYNAAAMYGTGAGYGYTGAGGYGAGAGYGTGGTGTGTGTGSRSSYGTGGGRGQGRYHPYGK